MEKILFEIPVSNWDKFKKVFGRLSNKATKLGFNVSADPIGQVDKMIGDKSVLCYEVYVQNDPVAVTSHEIIAKISHTEVNGIIHTSKNVVIPDNYLNNCGCNHCNVKRRRNTTYIIRHAETGELSQIGKTCLGDHFKIADPSNLVKYFEVIREIEDTADSYGSYYEHQDELFSVSEVVSAAKSSIEQFGFIPGGVDGSTREHIAKIHQSTKVDNEFVEAFKKWVDEKEINTHHDQNLKNFVLRDSTIASGFGYIAAAVNRYLKSLVKKENKSKFYGDIGGKCQLHLSATKLTKYEGAYGYGNRIEFVDNDGNIFVTFTTSSKIENGDSGMASFTVKKHNSFNNVEQTVIKFVKFI